ncbi:MAG: hypothetical protein JW874_04140 [Spirochaetales bacterium]|nr:hypothetical protein [Spirochaetales bacterium]
MYAVCVIQLKNLSVGRKKKLLLKNINLELSAGQRWYLYGNEEAGTVFNLLSGLVRDYSGSVHVLEFIPANRSPDYYRSSSFVPSYFPVYAISARLYIQHYRKIYPGLDSEMVDYWLGVFGIDQDQNIRKLLFSRRKIFHIILALARRPAFIMIQDLFHGIPDRDRCIVHNLFRRTIGGEQCLVLFGGRLTDYSDMINRLAFFSSGMHLKNYSPAELAREFTVMHIRSRKYLDHTPLAAIRMIRGWKILDNNTDHKPCPPDFELLASYFSEARDLVKIRDRMETPDEG